MKQIYYGGHIITMKSEKDFPEAVAVEDGRIVFVGNRNQAEVLFDEAENIDLKGRLCHNKWLIFDEK